jgi:hypothetical protein
MVSAMLPVLTAQGPLTNTMGKSAQPVNDEFGVQDNGTANTSFEQSNLVKLAAGLANPLIGAFNQSGDNVTGSYVSFAVDNSTGTIMNYSLMPAAGSNVTLLNSVQVGGLDLGNAVVKGPVYAASNGSFGMAIHDNPEGTMHMSSTGPAEVNMTLATGFSVAVMPTSIQNLKAWTITGNGVTCVLMVWNGTVTPGAASNQTTSVMPSNNTTQSTNTTQTTPSTSGNMTTMPVCIIKSADGNATNMTNMNAAGGGQALNIALENNSFVVLRAIPNEPGFSQADQQAIANAIAGGMVNTEMSIQSALVKQVTVNPGNATVNATGNQTVNRTANVTVNATTSFVTWWYAIEYFPYSMSEVTKATLGNVTIEVTSLVSNATKSVSNATGNENQTAGGNVTAGNMTANATANQTANATAKMPTIWIINVDDQTLGVGNRVANVSLDGQKLNSSGSLQALLNNNATDAYFQITGANANKFIVNIGDPTMNHTLQISTLAGAVMSNVTGNTTTGNTTSSAGASGVGAIGIGVIGLAGIAACVFVVRRKK